MREYVDRRVKLQNELVKYASDHLIAKGYPKLEAGGEVRDLQLKKIGLSTPLDKMSVVFGFKFGNFNAPEHCLILVFNKTDDDHPEVSIHTEAGTVLKVAVTSEDMGESISTLKAKIDETLDDIALSDGR